MFHHIREVRPWAVAGAAPYDLIGVGDVDAVLGVDVGKHPALINKVIPALRPPQLHGVTPRFMVGGQFQMGPVVAVHIYAANFHHTSPPADSTFS